MFNLLPNHVNHTDTLTQTTAESFVTLDAGEESLLMINGIEAEAIYIQLYWLCLNGLVDSKTIFSLERAPFGENSRFRIGYCTLHQLTRHRVQLITRYRLLCKNHASRDYFGDLTSRPSRNVNTCHLLAVLPPSEVLARLDLLNKVAIILQKQFRLPVGLEQVFSTINNGGLQKFGVGVWIALCNEFDLTQSNTLTPSVLRFLSGSNVSHQRHFEAKMFVQWIGDNNVDPTLTVEDR